MDKEYNKRTQKADEWLKKQELSFDGLLFHNGRTDRNLVVCLLAEYLKESVASLNSINDSTGINADADHTKIKDRILDEYKKGNIVVSSFEGLMVAPIKQVINQPVDGLLYDLNRNEVTVLNYIDDPKWINDFAMVQVIRELKQQLESNTVD